MYRYGICLEQEKWHICPYRHRCEQPCSANICQMFEFMNPDLAGQSVSPLIETMCERSQKYIMWGKVVLVLAAGGASKRFIWTAAKEENIKVGLELSHC